MLLKKRVVGMLSVMLSAAMVFNIAVMGTPRAEAASIGELNSQYSDLQQQINDLQGDLDSKRPPASVSSTANTVTCSSR